MELLVQSSGKTRILPVVDPVGKFPVQISLVGHQIQWGGGEHLPPCRINEAGVPTLTLSIHPGYGRARPHAKRPSLRGGKSGLPGGRKNHGPGFHGRHHALPTRHARQHGKDPKSSGHLLQGVRSKNKLEQIIRDLR